MRFLNLLGNKAFSLVFSALLGQPVKDTLCGTKALKRAALRGDRRGPLVLRRLRPVRRLRPAARGGTAAAEDRRPPGALPVTDVRRDEDLAVPARLAARADGGVRLPQAEDPDLRRLNPDVRAATAASIDRGTGTTQSAGPTSPRATASRQRAWSAKPRSIDSIEFPSGRGPGEVDHVAAGEEVDAAAVVEGEAWSIPSPASIALLGRGADRRHVDLDAGSGRRSSGSRRRRGAAGRRR